jgi:hypothetical protein
MTFLISMEVSRGTTMMDMITASTITMNTTMKWHRRMIRFMHPYAMKRLSSYGMSTHTATGEGPSIGTGMITRRPSSFIGSASVGLTSRTALLGAASLLPCAAERCVDGLKLSISGIVRNNIAMSTDRWNKGRSGPMIAVS